MIALDGHLTFPAAELRKILELALSRGGEFAEIYGEYRMFGSINMEEDIIKETAETISLGLGIRVICGDKTGYGYTNDLSLDKIRKAALAAAAIASGKGARSIRRFQHVRIRRAPYPVREPFQETGLSQKIDLVKKAYLACQKSSQKIKKVRVALQDHIRHVFIVNSAGLVAQDARPQVRLICTAVAEKGKRREIGFSGGGGRVGRDYFRDVLTPERIGQEAAEEALTLLQAVEAPAGEMPVVLAPGHSGVLVHEAVGHLLEADFNRKKTSIFWNKLGKKVGTELLTITDDPTIPFFRGSYAVDDEGTPPRKTILIEKGRVVTFLQDRLSAQLMRKPLTGHGRRQDFTCIPLPRMSNTYIERGKDNPEDIIKSVTKGIYAEKFEGGQVEDSGKFTFSISSGHLIEAGRLTAPIKQATLIGTNIDILQKIVMVGSDLSFGLQTGTCSKEGQEVPVTDGCPTIKISWMTVGGKR
jgi:TldD protein